MVRGLDHFKNKFKKFSDNFVLIGGVSSYLLLEEAGAAKVRPTKDLDIVIFLKPSDEFLRAFRKYIDEGNYQIEKGESSKASFYRFKKPKDENFPIMIELFSAVKDGFELFHEQNIIPISTPADVQSLSAILLDDEYFELIKRNLTKKNEINLLNEIALIPLKAKAYLDIKKRNGDSKQWKKHRGDIINLTVSFISMETKENLNDNIKKDFKEFIDIVKDELTPGVIMGACNIKVSADEIINLLTNTYLS